MGSAGGEGVESSQRAESSCTARRAIAVALAVFAGAVNLTIALHFDGMKGFAQLDLFFNADASARLHCMVDDRCGGRSSFSHPNLALFVNPPVRLASSLITLGGVTGIEPEHARRIAALCVSPLASALKAPIAFYLLLALGLTLSQAGLLALLSAVSFSQLAFGSIPEAFALSGLLLAAAYWLALHCIRVRDRKLWPWVALGIFVTGVTVSNLVSVAILFGVVGLAAGERVWVVFARTGAVVASVLLATALLATAFGAAYQLKVHRAGERAIAMPSALAHTFAAPEPSLGPNVPARLGGSRYQYRFLVAHRERGFCFDHWLGVVFVGLFVLGGIGYRRAPTPARWLCGASLAILIFNWGLHSIWGVDLILYSQHWQMALLVLLAGLYFAFPASTSLVTAALCALLLATGLGNLRSGAAMTDAMQIEHRGSGEHSDLKDYR